MKWTKTLIPTLRETPKDAEATSHKLMLRGGFVRKLASGVYSYLPLGFRVIRKIEGIIREEMNAKGADEVLLPALHPAELWEKTGRYEALGEDKIGFRNRTGQEFVLGPTHEEVITDLVANNVKSYKELPVVLYQIQTKFRDELRPRFGVIRSKEFIMKDAYSFDRSWEALDASYKKMYEAYKTVFSRAGLEFEIIKADPGIMGGNVSHEFMVKAEFGEDIIACCTKCSLREGPGLVSCLEDPAKDIKPGQNDLEEFDTPDLKTIEELCNTFKFKPQELIKTIVYLADGKPVAALVRGDREVNDAKLKKVLGAGELVPATAEEIENITGGPLGFSGPVGLKDVKIIADFEVRNIKNGYTGANKKDKHLKNVNINRDFKPDIIADVRMVADDDKCSACGKGKIKLERAMEIGHVFKLGTKYTHSLGALFLDEDGKNKEIIMGCYGIGVNRIMAAAIEQHNDSNGIIWPVSIAPYEAIILPLNQSIEALDDAANQIYRDLRETGVDVLYDDRNERAGVKFNDADLIGIPIQIVLGEKSLKKGMVEVKIRGEKKAEHIPLTHVVSVVQAKISLLKGSE